ncbi:hypothetical protein BpHYR1_032871 [Brachionus plicatilis]|uniref:Uncharacterized protein n=1 Tax=Brachionus plicatilis TaxID=10195 RepID=A0A3M7QSJ5_BRAPC|nr:hypothetical protein BpHYR1_032871 [Brachionus plicatilis]
MLPEDFLMRTNFFNLIILIHFLILAILLAFRILYCFFYRLIDSMISTKFIDNDTIDKNNHRFYI